MFMSTPAHGISGYLTNKEVMALTEPDNTKYLPYVYEDVTWKHCEQDGYHFPNVV